MFLDALADADDARRSGDHVAYKTSVFVLSKAWRTADARSRRADLPGSGA
ncbi:hypothetical protein [Streptomyces sp. NPDC048473]